MNIFDLKKFDLKGYLIVAGYRCLTYFFLKVTLIKFKTYIM